MQNPIWKAAVASSQAGGGPPPVAGVVWDGPISSSNAPTLNESKSIASFNVAGGGNFGAVKSATLLPDTDKRVIAFKYSGGNAECFGTMGLANSSFDIDNLFATLFGNAFFIGGQVENGGAPYNGAGKDSPGGFSELSPDTNPRNGDLVVIVIDGTNWQFFINNVRLTNLRLDPNGGDFGPTFNQLFVGAGTIGPAAGTVNVELISTKAELEAENISSYWFPAGTKTFLDEVIAPNVGSKIAWINPVSGASTMLYGRLTDGARVADLHELPGSNLLCGSSSFNTGSITDWVAQEFEIVQSDVDGVYTAEFLLSATDSAEIRVDYNHNSGNPNLSVVNGGPAVNISALAAGDLIGIAYNRVNDAYAVYYKPNGGGEVTIDSGTVAASLSGELLYRVRANGGDDTNGLQLRLKQGGDYGISLYPGTTETILGEAI